MVGAQAGESEAGVFIPDQEGRVKTRKAEWMDSLVLREEATGAQTPGSWGRWSLSEFPHLKEGGLESEF